MKSLLIYSCVFLMITACESPPTAIDMEQKDTMTSVSSIEKATDPFEDSLNAYFENPLDFYQLQKGTIHRHSGGSPDFKKENFHAISDPDAKFYVYWAIEFDTSESARPPALLFATWKPWKKARQKYYETNNETLVGIQSKLFWNGLKQSNFVNKTKFEIESKFGPAHFSQNECACYLQDDQLLILHFKKNVVDWFKYFWLKDSNQDIDSIPGSFFEWKNS